MATTTTMPTFITIIRKYHPTENSIKTKCVGNLRVSATCVSWLPLEQREQSTARTGRTPSAAGTETWSVAELEYGMLEIFDGKSKFSSVSEHGAHAKERQRILAKSQ